jgi:hypothetical protein
MSGGSRCHRQLEKPQSRARLKAAARRQTAARKVVTVMPRPTRLSIALGAGLGLLLSTAWADSRPPDADDLAKTPPALQVTRDAESAAAPPPLSGVVLELDPRRGALVPPPSATAWHPPEGDLQLELDLGDWRMPRRLVPALEIGLILTAFGAEYHSRQTRPPEWGLSTWPERVSTTRWFILDTSPFSTNYAAHTIAGSSYHLATRTSDLGLLESTLWSVGASLLWEYVVEYRQKVDLNDLIFTTPAGIAAGEFMLKLGRFLHQRDSGPGWGGLRWTLGFPESLNSALSGVDGDRGPEVAGRFRLSAGAAHASGTERSGVDFERATSGLGHVRIEAILDTFEDLDRQGATWTSFRDGNLTSLDLLVSGSGSERSGVYVLSDTLLAGWRFREVDAAGGRGQTLDLGSSIAVRYQRERYGPWNDRLGLAHLPGLAAGGATWGPRWRLEGSARLHLDYGGVHALSAERWLADHPDEVGLSTVEQELYYHAYGVSGRVRGVLEIPYVRAGGELFLGRYRTHRARDKYEAELTTKQRIATRAADYALWLQGSMFGPFFVEARMDRRHRAETFEDLDARQRLRRYSLDLGATF